jgi:uncharacterized tellurite resistance protein B-like protein
MKTFDEVKKMSWLVFRGWVMDTYSDVDRNNMIKEMRNYSDFLKTTTDISPMQAGLFQGCKSNVSFERFLQEVPETRKLAAKAGISNKDIYLLYLIATVDGVISAAAEKEFETFVDVGYTDKKRKDLSFLFAVAMVDGNLTNSFRAEMIAKERRAISLARSDGKSFPEIITLIKQSNDRAMDFYKFRSSLTVINRVFKLGGIKDEREIFEDFKILLAYNFYNLGTR